MLRDLDFFLDTEDCFFERECQVRPKIGSALRPRSSTCSGAAEERVEDVLEPEASAEAAKAAVEGRIDTRVAEAVVSAALIAVAQDLVRLVDLLELLGGGRIRVSVRMVVERELAERAPDVAMRLYIQKVGADPNPPPLSCFLDLAKFTFDGSLVTGRLRAAG